MSTSTYIALLRGINVSGRKIIPMVDLKAMFVKLGFKDAKTFIQSGNVVFTSSAAAPALVKTLEAGIKKAFAFEVTVVVKSLAEMEKIVAANPYKKPKEGERPYITFLAEAPGKEGIAALEAAANDIDHFSVAKSAVYILARKGYGESKFSNNFVEAKLKVRATTRNVDSTVKLIALASAL